MGPALRRDVLGTMLDGFRQYGDLVAYRLGPRVAPGGLSQHAVAVHHPDEVQQVLARRPVFVRRSRSFEVLTEMIGTGLVTSDGDVWLRQRRTLQPLFTSQRIAGYAALMTAEVQRIAADPTLGSGAVVDLHELMQLYTARVVGRALFGDDVDDLVPDLQRLVPLMTRVALARALQPVRLPLTWPTVRNHRFRRVRAAQYAIVDKILARRLVRAVQGDDLIGRLQTARDPDSGLPLSTQEIRDQALAFLLAGHETTAAALTFTLHQLGRHPHVQEQVACAPADDVERMARAAVLEAMRLFPPVYSLSRRAAVDTDIGGHPISAGTIVIVSAWVTHRHPSFWAEPGRFEPSRFIDDHSRPRYAYFPFGGGPHGCIGEQFALLEATELLKGLLPAFRIDSLDADVRLAPLLTLRPAAPVRAALTKR
jgi:cytochrome P450